jgi:photosystem II stability/assembly factor-like uncharacterized protein
VIISEGTAGSIYTSADGKTWANPDAPSGTGGLHSVAYGGGLFVAVGDGGTIIHSTDSTAASWIYAADTPLGSGDILSSVAYGGGAFVAVGSNGAGQSMLVESSDGGDNWTDATPLSVLYPFQSVSFANGSFFAATSTSAPTEVFYKSGDGIHWSQTEAYPNTGRPSAVVGVSYGNGIYLAVDTNGFVFSSSTAATWTQVSDTGANFTSLCFGMNYFTLLSSWGVIYLTSDGVTYSFPSPGLAENASYNAIQWVPSLGTSGSFVVAGISGGS